MTPDYTPGPSNAKQTRMLTPLGALRIVDRPAWEARVRAALQGRTQAQAARELGVSLRHLHAWCAELGVGRGQGWRAPGA